MRTLRSSDLKPLGLFQLPNDGASDFGYADAAAISGRNVNGAIRIFITGQSTEAKKGTGQGYLIHEVAYPGAGSFGQFRAPLVTFWGDVYRGRLQTMPESGVDVRGLLFKDGLLWVAYGGNYNTGGNHDPSILCADLDGGQSFGPWRTTDHSQRTRGYLVPLPDGSIGVGAPVTSGDFFSPFGCHLEKLQPFNPRTTPADSPNDGHQTIACAPLITYLFDSPQTVPAACVRRFCEWNHIYDCAGGVVVGIDNTFKNNGRGLDTVSAAAWVKTADVEGLIFFGDLVDTIAGYDYGSDTIAHSWYAPLGMPCCHGQHSTVGDGTGPKASTMTPWAWIYDPATLNGGQVKEAEAVRLDAISSIPAQSSGSYQFGGSWFDPISGLLFLAESGRDNTQHDWRPVVHVFQVGDGIGTTPIVLPPAPDPTPDPVIVPAGPPSNEVLMAQIDEVLTILDSIDADARDQLAKSSNARDKLNALKSQLASGTPPVTPPVVPPVVPPVTPPGPPVAGVQRGKGPFTDPRDQAVYTLKQIRGEPFYTMFRNGQETPSKAFDATCLLVAPSGVYVFGVEAFAHWYDAKTGALIGDTQPSA